LCAAAAFAITSVQSSPQQRALLSTTNALSGFGRNETDVRTPLVREPRRRTLRERIAESSSI
jgi:hypothetical protein